MALMSFEFLPVTKSLQVAALDRIASVLRSKIPSRRFCSTWNAKASSCGRGRLGDFLAESSQPSFAFGLYEKNPAMFSQDFLYKQKNQAVFSEQKALGINRGRLRERGPDGVLVSERTERSP